MLLCCRRLRCNCWYGVILLIFRPDQLMRCTGLCTFLQGIYYSEDDPRDVLANRSHRRKNNMASATNTTKLWVKVVGNGTDLDPVAITPIPNDIEGLKAAVIQMLPLDCSAAFLKVYAPGTDLGSGVPQPYLPDDVCSALPQTYSRLPLIMQRLPQQFQNVRSINGAFTLIF
jgi:hypothetical protein